MNKNDGIFIGLELTREACIHACDSKETPTEQNSVHTVRQVFVMMSKNSMYFQRINVKTKIKSTLLNGKLFPVFITFNSAN